MTLLTKEELSHVLKMQLYYEKNRDVRSYIEIARDFPLRLSKSVGLTMATGIGLTFGSSFFVFRRFSTAVADVKQAVPAVAAFATADFGLNYALTRVTGKRIPERWMSVASASAAGVGVGYVVGGGRGKSAVLGGVCGAVYGLVRNYPMDLLGFEPF
jgi:hypothetical protein